MRKADRKVTQSFPHRLSRKFSLKVSRGDTIVEVLIVTALISSVLAGAFTVTQRSTSSVRDNQERGEILQLLQGQIEAIRTLALSVSDENTGIFVAATPYFCINPATNQPQSYTSTQNVPTVCKTGTDNRYNMAITYNNSSHTFDAQGFWDDISGLSNKVQLSYRVLPGQIGATAVTTAPSSPTAPTTPACNVSDMKDIVITADTSSSMTAAYAPSQTSRITYLRQTTTYFVENSSIAPDGNQVGIVSFNATPSLAIQLTSSVPALKSAINNMTVRVGTNYIPALTASKTELIDDGRAGTQKVLIFISDGDAYNERASNIYAKTDELAAAGIKIYTIGITTGVAAQNVLRNMVRGGGNFIQADDPDQLHNAMAAIASDASCR